MQSKTFYWHDYETFGVNPQLDRPSQFAGVRTDIDLNIIGDPLKIYCKPTIDYLPDPDACLITGITPQLAIEKGLSEVEFIRLIHQQLEQPDTCTVGYNNIRFDDEVTRNVLYRNFYDPYAREWQNGNSRWDLIDLARLTRALRPDGIQWPTNEEGAPSFRLEELTAANGIKHDAAHDALSDVYATIAVAKLIKQKQPKLYQYVFTHRSKTEVSKLLKLGSMTPVLHVSGMYAAQQGCLAVVLPLCQHPTNNNGILVYDLSKNPENLTRLSAQEIHHRIFTAQHDHLPENTERIPIKTVHINKCPIITPVSVMLPQDAERLGIDFNACLENLKIIKRNENLTEKLDLVFGQDNFKKVIDPDLQIYSGGFFCAADKTKMDRIRTTPSESLSNLNLEFKDSRMQEMLFRYRARNFPETLTREDQRRWQEFCSSRLVDKDAGGGIVLEGYFSKLNELKNQQGIDKKIILDLEEYAKQLMIYAGIDDSVVADR